MTKISNFPKAKKTGRIGSSVLRCWVSWLHWVVRCAKVVRGSQRNTKTTFPGGLLALYKPKSSFSNLGLETMFRASVAQRDEKAKVGNRQTWVVIRQERLEIDRNIHAHCVLPTKSPSIAD